MNDALLPGRGDYDEHLNARDPRTSALTTILSTATAVPTHCFTLAQAKACLRETMALDPERQAAVESIFDHACVDQRYSVSPLSELPSLGSLTQRSLTQASREYREHAVSLGKHVASDCLAEAGVCAEQVDLLITVSCTGVMLPSLDAYLINELGFRRDVRRLPITELGCSAGAAALARAHDFITAYPSSTVLAVSVELPTLTFQVRDSSMANLVACALFGDGAAAAVLRGGNQRGMQILDCESQLFPDSYDALGFELREGGLHIVLGNQLAAMVRSQLGDLVRMFLLRRGLTLDALEFVVLHPGGRKLIEAVERELGLTRQLTQPSWDVLRQYGNQSSAAVLFVLHEWLTKQPPAAGAYGMMIAFGPGFSAEMLLLQWL